MNAAFFLTPKNELAFLFDDCTLRQGLEKMRSSGYTAIPVIKRDGTYVGIVQEGDFLWHLIGKSGNTVFSLRDLENERIPCILQTTRFPAVRIIAPMDDIVDRALTQNFVPIVDDSDKFIGIVTRNRVMRYLTERKSEPLPRPADAATL